MSHYSISILFSFLLWINLGYASTYSFSSVQFLPPTSFTERSDRFVTSSASLSPSSKLFSTNNNRLSTGFQKPDFNWNFRRNFQFNSLKNNNQFGSDFGRNLPSFGSSFPSFGSNLPSFGSRLSNSDPYLLSGPNAKNVANYLYSKEPFFDNIPHVRSLLRNQNERRFNGLPMHKLGSLRFGSPWYRFDTKTINPFFL